MHYFHIWYTRDGENRESGYTFCCETIEEAKTRKKELVSALLTDDIKPMSDWMKNNLGFNAIVNDVESIYHYNKNYKRDYDLD